MSHSVRFIMQDLYDDPTARFELYSVDQFGEETAVGCYWSLVDAFIEVASIATSQGDPWLIVDMSEVFPGDGDTVVEADYEP